MAVGAAVTVTVAEALSVLSATLVAMTWKVPALDGAVYRPDPLMVPPAAPSCTDQLTAVDWPPLIPVTEAVKFTVPPAWVEAESGRDGDGDVRRGGDGDGGAALLEASATLVATTWNVPGVPGAVYRPGGVDVASGGALLDGPGDLGGLTPARSGDRGAEGRDRSGEDRGRGR